MPDTTKAAVVSAMRMATGVIRAVLREADGTFDVVDWDVVDATKLPPLELPAGVLMKAYVDAGGAIGTNTAPVPTVPGYVAPPVPAPQATTVTRLQGRLALSRAGLLDRAEAAVAAAGGETAIWYADAQVWRRDDPHVAAIGAALKLTDAAVDGLFAEASKVV